MYLWSFLAYGFLGYLLEKVYALVTRSRHTVRKGYLLLPVCPVYGLAMLAVLALPPGYDGHLLALGPLWRTHRHGGRIRCPFLLRQAAGGHVLGLLLHQNGPEPPVCLPFALIWGPLGRP